MGAPKNWDTIIAQLADSTTAKIKTFLDNTFTKRFNHAIAKSGYNKDDYNNKFEIKKVYIPSNYSSSGIIELKIEGLMFGYDKMAKSFWCEDGVKTFISIIIDNDNLFRSINDIKNASYRGIVKRAGITANMSLNSQIAIKLIRMAYEATRIAYFIISNAYSPERLREFECLNKNIFVTATYDAYNNTDSLFLQMNFDSFLKTGSEIVERDNIDKSL